jgi:hypothetical protein
MTDTSGDDDGGGYSSSPRSRRSSGDRRQYSVGSRRSRLCRGSRRSLGNHQSTGSRGDPHVEVTDVTDVTTSPRC